MPTSSNDSVPARTAGHRLPAEPGPATATGSFRRDAVTGFLGSLLVVVGGLGAGALRLQDPLLDGAHLSWLRYGHGKIFSTVLVYAGLLVMFYAWARIGRTARNGGCSTRSLTWTIAAWTVPLLVSVPLFSRDAYAYLSQGALFRDGFDPYTTTPVADPGPLLDNVSTVWTTTTAPYGPLFLILARGVTEITGDDPVAGTIALRIAMLPGLALMIWAMPRIARALGGSPATALWLAVLNPLILVHLVGGPHNELLMVGLLASGVALVLQRHHLLGIAVVSAAVAIKLPAAAALPFMVWIWMDHRRRDTAGSADGEPAEGRPAPGPRAAEPEAKETLPSFLRGFARTAVPAVAVFAAVFAAATTAAGAGFGWTAGLSNADKVINWLTLPTAAAQLYTVATSWFTGIPLDPVLNLTRLLCKAALAPILVVIIVKYRRSTSAAMHGVLYAMIAMLVLSVAAFPWYYSWPLAIAAGFALSDRTLGALTAFSVFVMLLFRPDGGIGMYQWYQLLFAAACAIVAAATVISREPLHPAEWLHPRRLQHRLLPIPVPRADPDASIAADTSIDADAAAEPNAPTAQDTQGSDAPD